MPSNMRDCNTLLRFFSSTLFVRALMVAMPNGLLAALLVHLASQQGENLEYSVLGVSQVWSGYNFVLGFLVVFRTQHAYARFWEGATLLQQVKGEWFNAVSSLIAFTAASPEKRQEVEHFQNLIVRLASMLHCAALQQVSVMEVKDFQTLDVEGIEPEALRFLQSKAEKCEVLLQWMQRAIVEAAGSGVLPIAPPILSRVFQELSRGIVNVNNARKITDIPFPAPYHHLIKIMLYIQWVVTPLVCSLLMRSMLWAAGLSTITIFAFASVVYIAAEIENPFGDDPYDLPLAEFQRSFNLSLLTLLEPQTQSPPKYVFRQVPGQGLSVDLNWLAPVIDADHPEKFSRKPGQGHSTLSLFGSSSSRSKKRLSGGSTSDHAQKRFSGGTTFSRAGTDPEKEEKFHDAELPSIMEATKSKEMGSEHRGEKLLCLGWESVPSPPPASFSSPAGLAPPAPSFPPLSGGDRSSLSIEEGPRDRIAEDHTPATRGGGRIFSAAWL